jgi:ABC-type dipeptide/oligopeptide/nickel transport system ATPase component
VKWLALWESGSGKSVSSLAIMGLIDYPAALWPKIWSLMVGSEAHF